LATLGPRLRRRGGGGSNSSSSFSFLLLLYAPTLLIPPFLKLLLDLDVVEIMFCSRGFADNVLLFLLLLEN
jgi:hypothetical protein